MSRVKLHRKLESREWYDDVPVKVLFLHFLIKANHKESRWKGEIIKPGQLVSGRSSLAIQTGLSEQQVRTAVQKLISTSEITIRSTSRFSVITLLNWDKYQLEEKNQPTNQPALQPTSNQQATTLKEIENKRNNSISVPDSKSGILLEEFIEKRNSVRRIKGRKGFISCRGPTKDIVKEWDKACKEYGIDGISLAVNAYIKEIKSRPDDSYADHRFSLYEFLKQKNGLKRFYHLA